MNSISAVVRTLFAAALFAVPNTSNAAEPVLKGRLVGENHTPIIEYSVIIKREEPEVKKYITTTDKDGYFSIQKLPLGKYVIRPFNAPDSSKVMAEIKKGAGGFPFWPFAMITPTPIDLGEILVP